MTNREGENPTLSYEGRPDRWRFTVSRRQILFAAVLFAVQLGPTVFLSVRGWWLRRAERQFNARVVPLVKADARFYWVFVGGEAGYIRGYISSSGVVQTSADLATLRAVLQGAQPPMPLDLQFVIVMNPAAATRPAAGGP